MVVIYNTAVRADGNVNACFLKIPVTGSRNLNDSRRLASADALRLTGNADTAAADADLNEVSPCSTR